MKIIKMIFLIKKSKLYLMILVKIQIIYKISICIKQWMLKTLIKNIVFKIQMVQLIIVQINLVILILDIWNLVKIVKNKINNID